MKNVNQLKFEEIVEENSNLKVENQELKEKCDKLMEENNELKEENNKLSEEKKDNLLEIKELKEEIKTYKMKCIDTTKYEEWTSDEIVLWIMSLENGRYDKYTQKLAQELKNEGVSGACLESVNEIDVKGWGVNNFADKKSLTKSIQQLVSQKNVEHIPPPNANINVSDVAEGNLLDTSYQ